MSNTEFWQHIDTIIARGYDAQGLKLLEEYAELFISGRLVYKRFSPLEQHGCAAGGSNHVIASLLAGAEDTTDTGYQTELSDFQRERQCAEKQEKRIEQWAMAVGCWMDNVDNSLLQVLGSHIAEGGEAKVYDHNTPALRAEGTRILTTEIETK